MTCLAPACGLDALELGPYGFLCVPHALAVAQVAPTWARDPFTVTERLAMRRKWRDEPWTDHDVKIEHGPSKADALEPELLAAAALAMRALGATLLRIEPTYGAVDGLPEHEVIPARAIPVAGPSRALTVRQDAEQVPRTARSIAKAASAGGWSVRLRWVPGVDSLVLRAWRGSLLVVVTFLGGKFDTAWAMRGRDLPIALGARQAAALVKAAP